MTKRSLAACTRVALIHVLAICVAVTFSPAAMAQSGMYADAMVRLDVQRALLESVTAESDRSAFDVDALALELAFEEPVTIVDHVTTSIRYQVYRGLLRGPNGTLIAGAGNALDQAVLLARLMNDAGFEARIGTGTLSADDAMRLVMSMFEEHSPRPDQVGPHAVLEAFSAITGTPVEDFERDGQALANFGIEETEAFEAAAEARTSIMASIERLGVPVGGEVTEQLRSEASEYAWVEYRLDETSPWTEAHPAFGGSAAPAVIERGEYLTGTVPEQMTHRLRIEVSIERKRGDAFHVEPLMAPWEKPTANLIGETITVGNTVVGAPDGTSLQEIGTSLADATLFVPVLNGSLAPGAQAFDLLGNVVPPDAAANPAAGVFQTAGSKVNEAAGALGGLGGGAADSEPFALTAQWVDFVLIEPGGEETRHRRFVFDRRDPVARANGGSALLDKSVLLEGIITSFSFMVTAGELSAEFLAYQTAQQGLAYLDVMVALIDAQARSAASEADEVSLSELLAELEGVGTRDQLLIMSGFDAVDAAEGGVGYRAEPTIVALRQAITPGEQPQLRSGVDIVNDVKRFYASGDGSVVTDFETAVLAGTWDTEVERQYVARYGERVHSVYAAFEGNGASGVAVDVYDEAKLLDHGVPRASLPVVKRDLDAGYVVILPPEAPPDGVEWAWWRVDVATGETLGMGASGQGVAAPEWQTVHVIVSAALLAALAVPAAMMCSAKSGDDLIICFCDIVAGGMIFLPLGVLIGAAFGAQASIAAFLYLDIGFGVAMLTAIGGPCTWADRAMSRAGPTCVMA